jgi:hypothetical protein
MANEDTGTILELYKTAVEMADRTSARRAGANSFFLTLNTALVAVVGIVSSARKPVPHGNPRRSTPSDSSSRPLPVSSWLSPGWHCSGITDV